MCAIFTGKQLIRLKEVDSTNNYLSNLALKENISDGTVVMADHQFAGKGQRGNSWQTEKNKNLTFSIFYAPIHASLNKQFLLTQAISLGVYDYLITKCKQVKIKWPNDLYISNKKVGGILIENSIKGENISQIVIGIGLNINQTSFNWPENKATSLQIENADDYQLQEELSVLLSFIERRYLQWKNGHYSVINNQYLEVLYLYQSWHIFRTPEGNYFDGKIIGIDEAGQLIIEDTEAHIHKFGNKQIIF